MAVPEARANRQFNYAYIAPPQYQGLWPRALLALEDHVNDCKDYGTILDLIGREAVRVAYLMSLKARMRKNGEFK